MKYLKPWVKTIWPIDYIFGVGNFFFVFYHLNFKGMKVKAGKYSFDKIYLLPIEFVLKTDGKIMPFTITLLLICYSTSIFAKTFDHNY